MDLYWFQISSRKIFLRMTSWGWFFWYCERVAEIFSNARMVSRYSFFSANAKVMNSAISFCEFGYKCASGSSISCEPATEFLGWIPNWSCQRLIFLVLLNFYLNAQHNRFFIGSRFFIVKCWTLPKFFTPVIFLQLYRNFTAFRADYFRWARSNCWIRVWIFISESSDIEFLYK